MNLKTDNSMKYQTMANWLKLSIYSLVVLLNKAIFSSFKRSISCPIVIILRAYY